MVSDAFGEAVISMAFACMAAFALCTGFVVGQLAEDLHGKIAPSAVALSAALVFLVLFCAFA